MPRDDADGDHEEHDPRHDENSRPGILYLPENYPERDIQYHYLHSEPHLVIHQEQSEEGADDLRESEAAAVHDIAQQRIGQVDIVADKEGHEDSEDPSLHEAFGVIAVGHPSLYKSET